MAIIDEEASVVGMECKDVLPTLVNLLHQG